MENNKNTRIPLEESAIKVADAAAVEPLIFKVKPAEGRERLEKAQNDTPVHKYPAMVKSIIFDTGEWGKVPVYIVVPENYNDKKADVIFYTHGAGWVFGSFNTHEKLVRELAHRANSILIFPEYSRAPEAQYPIAIEQSYILLTMLPILIKMIDEDREIASLTVAGDSVGGNMATVMALMAKLRKGPKIQRQLLFYPVTDANFETSSYQQFATNYYLYREGMMWFWNQYLPNAEKRHEIFASPLQATLEDLKDLPPALIITDEADVLRDEGEAYGRKLLEAGNDVTSVRVNGIIHDFVMLNALDQSNGCRIAMDIAIAWLKRKK